MASAKEPKPDDIVIISHADGTRLALPFESYAKFYESGGWTLEKEKPVTIEQTQAEAVAEAEAD